MDEVVKKKIKESMNSWLTSHGWPDKLTDNQVIQKLPEIWKHLESQGLLKEVIAEGFTYTQFVNSAIHAKRQADFKAQFTEKMRGFGFWK